MSKENEKWYNHGWMFVVGGALLAPVGTLIFDWIKNLPVLTTITKLLYKIYSVSTLTIPLYLCLIIVIGANLAWRIFLELENRKLLDTNNKGFLKANQIEMLDYKADKFDRLVFKWVWIANKLTKKYEVKNVKAVCPKQSCEYNELTYFGFEAEIGKYLYECNKCKTTLVDSYSPSDIIDEVETKFER